VKNKINQDSIATIMECEKQTALSFQKTSYKKCSSIFIREKCMDIRRKSKINKHIISRAEIYSCRDKDKKI